MLGLMPLLDLGNQVSRTLLMVVAWHRLKADAAHLCSLSFHFQKVPRLDPTHDPVALIGSRERKNREPILRAKRQLAGRTQIRCHAIAL